MVLRPDYLALAVVVGLVHFQYRRVATVEERLFGRVKYEPRRQTTSSILWPLAGPGYRAFYPIGISLSDSGVATFGPWPYC